MGLLDPITDAYKTLTGAKEKEDLLATIQEWDKLLRACTDRIEGLDKGYDFLRRNMFLKRELIVWKRLAVVSGAISLVTLAVAVYWIFKMH